MQAYLLTTSKHLLSSKSQVENCSCDCSVPGVHDMRQRYDSCCCSEGCEFKFKVKICQKSSHIELFEPDSQFRECPNGLQTKAKKRRNCGVSDAVKQLIEHV